MLFQYVITSIPTFVGHKWPHRLVLLKIFATPS